MSDDWRRPGPDHESRPACSVEIPLTGAAPPGDPAGPARPPTNWRRLVAIAAVGGAVLGVALGVVLLALDDGDGDRDDGGATTSTAGPADPTALTAPPTLAPPPEPAVAGEALAGPDVTLPSYARAGVAAPAATGFDLDAAVAALAEDRPRRASTTFLIGRDGYRLEVTVDRDVVRDRYRIDIRTPTSDAVELVIDVSTATTYVTTGAGAPQVVPNEELLRGGSDVGEFARRLLLGPVRADTTQSARSVPGELVVLQPGAVVVRRHDVTIDAAAVPEWARYGLGPQEDAPPPQPGDTITFATYVTGDDRIVQIDGVFPYGATDQLTMHAIEVLAPDFRIPIPDR